jgi:hypothetical protein
MRFPQAFAWVSCSLGLRLTLRPSGSCCLNIRIYDCFRMLLAIGFRSATASMRASAPLADSACIRPDGRVRQARVLMWARARLTERCPGTSAPGRRRRRSLGCRRPRRSLGCRRLHGSQGCRGCPRLHGPLGCRGCRRPHGPLGCRGCRRPHGAQGCRWPHGAQGCGGHLTVQTVRARAPRHHWRGNRSGPASGTGTPAPLRGCSAAATSQSNRVRMR